MKSKTNIVKSILLILALISLGYLSFRVYEPYKKYNHNKYIPPDKLPTIRINRAEVMNKELIIVLSIESKGKTPVLFESNRLSVKLKNNKGLVIQGRDYYQQIQGKKIYPQEPYILKFNIPRVGWYEGSYWKEILFSELKDGLYDLQIFYSGNKPGFLKGNYDFPDPLVSNIVKLEIQ